MVWFAPELAPILAAILSKILYGMHSGVPYISNSFRNMHIKTRNWRGRWRAPLCMAHRILDKMAAKIGARLGANQTNVAPKT